jgi:hypothetical protein
MDSGILTNATALVVSIFTILTSTVFAVRQLRSARTSKDTVIAVHNPTFHLWAAVQDPVRGDPSVIVRSGVS